MIFIDDRVGSVELHPTFLTHRTRPTCTLTRLIAGDMCFSGNGANGTCMVGIERKRIATKKREDGLQFRDLLSSIREGRFSGEQLPKLLDQYEYVFLIVEGIFKTDKDTGYLMTLNGRQWEMVTIGRSPYYAKELYNFLATIGLNTSVQCIITSGDVETVEHVLRLHEYFQKPWSGHHEHLSLNTAPQHLLLGKAGTVRRVAAALDGVGWEKSGTIAANFKCVVRPTEGPYKDVPSSQIMCEASVKEWMKLPGFGKVLANRVWKELRGLYEGGGDRGGIEL
jgi:ERCC4-type nuclease